jgi:membrane protease YdiL (CAAX protease family)
MEGAVILGGLALEASAWWLVAFRRLDVWAVMTPTMALLALLAFVAGPPAWATDVGEVAAVLAGAASGAALYLATRGFIVAVRPWATFQRHSSGVYGGRVGRSLPAVLALTVLLIVPGEELFWRGFAQAQLVETFDGAALLGATVAWVAFVLASLPSANLAILAGTVVGGGVWTALGWWSGGALAPLASHLAWTSLMLAFPVVTPVADVATAGRELTPGDGVP